MKEKAGRSKSKQTVRQGFLAVRTSLDPGERNKANRQIFKRLIAHPAFLKAQRIGAYMSFGTEVSTRGIPEICWKKEKTIAVPVTARWLKKTFFSEIALEDPMITSELGTLEPPRSAWKPVAAKDLDLIIVPGVAFDKSGHRVGYGGGVFDRLLASAPQAVRIGLGFECQITTRLPSQKLDEPLDFLITEERVLRWPRKR
jgi:5-formyltetrahydrofolate cyclo-ligase